MEFSEFKVLLRSISSFLNLSSSRHIDLEPFEKYYKIVENLLKPISDVVVNSDLVLDEKLCKAFEELTQDVDQSIDLFRSWKAFSSKVYFVLQIESLIPKMRDTFVDAFQFLPDELSPASLEQCVEKIKYLGFEDISSVVDGALRDQRDGVGPSPEILVRIGENTGLRSNQEILIEAVALERQKEIAEQSGNNAEVEFLDQPIVLVNRMHEHLLLIKQTQTSSVAILADFFCPLSLEVMTNPVIVSTGQTYEKAFIKRWIDLGLKVCPKTRQTLTHTTLIPNYTVKALIANWCETNDVKLSDLNKSMSLNNLSPLLSCTDSIPSTGANDQDGSPSRPASTLGVSSPGVSLYDIEERTNDSQEMRTNAPGRPSVSSTTRGSMEKGQTSENHHHRFPSATSTVSNEEFPRTDATENSEDSAHSSDASGENGSRPIAATTSASPQQDFSPKFMDRRGQFWRRPSNRLRPLNRLGSRIVSVSSNATRPDLSEVESQVKKLVEELKSSSLEIQKQTPPPSDGGVPRLVSFVTDYCNKLNGEKYKLTLTQVLLIHKSWRSERFRYNQLMDEVLRIIKAIEQNLDVWMKAYPDLTLAHFFGMNNHWHLYMNLKGTRIGDQLGDSWLKEHEQYKEYYATVFLRDSWGKLPSHLSREGLILFSGGQATARDLVKKRLKAFDNAFDEMYKKQATWVLPGKDWRDRACQQIVQAIVPVYRSYMQNYGPLVEKDASSSKYVKYTVVALEKLLSSLYMPKPFRYGSFKGTSLVKQWEQFKNTSPLEAEERSESSEEEDDKGETSENEMLWREMELCLASCYILDDTEGRIDNEAFKKDDKETSASTKRVTKDPSPEDRRAESCTSSFGKKSDSRNVRSFSKKPQQSSGSVSPRLQQKKHEYDRRSRPPTSPDSNKSKKPSNQQLVESTSPGGRRKPKAQKSFHQNADQLIQASNESRTSSLDICTQSETEASACIEKDTEADGGKSPSVFEAAKAVVSNLMQHTSSPSCSEDANVSPVSLEHPSPISVLDSSMYGEIEPSPVKTQGNVAHDSGEEHCEDQWNPSEIVTLETGGEHL